jgi:hypothetical protein
MATACGVLAVFFVIKDDFEKAFVAATVGAVCWFLNYRTQLKESIPREDDEEESDEEASS